MNIKLSKKTFLVGLSGFIIGLIIILGTRFLTYQPAKDVHYHANFAVYINGQREQFKNFTYYVDIEGSCTLEKQMTPRERAHMHGNVNDVVHIEDQTVTWGQFFQNIGWVVDPMVIRTPDQILLETDLGKINFLLNGKHVENIVNRVVNDKDRLLVDYGTNSDQVLQQEYESIATTASKYDTIQDPADCSGHKESTWQDRMKHMF